MSEIIESQASGFVTLDQCVRNALMDINAGMERYEQFKKWGLDTYNEWHLDMAQEVKTARLELTPWKAVYLPDDYVDWAMIGVEINNAINVFTNDDRIPLPTIDDDEDGELDAPTVPETLPVDQLPVPYWFWNVTERGEDKGGLFGLTTKDNGVGYYKFNTERREIQFSPSIDGDTVVYLEYISNGRTPGSKTVVSLKAGKLIEMGIHRWRVHFSKAPMWEKKLAKDAYYEQYHKTETRMLKISVEDVLECARDAYRLISSF